MNHASQYDSQDSVRLLLRRYSTRRRDFGCFIGKGLKWLGLCESKRGNRDVVLI